MRRMLMVTAASLALGATGAMAAGNHMGGGMAAGGMAGGRTTMGGNAGMSSGSAVGGMATTNTGRGMATPNTAMANPGTNMHANVRGAVVPNTAAAQNHMMMHGHRYAYSGVHDHDHDRWRHHGYWGGGYGGLYAYGGPFYDYDDDYYDNGCYQPRWVRTPYGWRWRDVWVCQ